MAVDFLRVNGKACFQEGLGRWRGPGNLEIYMGYTINWRQIICNIRRHNGHNLHTHIKGRRHLNPTYSYTWVCAEIPAEDTKVVLNRCGSRHRLPSSSSREQPALLVERAHQVGPVAHFCRLQGGLRQQLQVG